MEAMKPLLKKRQKFVKYLTEGHLKKKSAILAGYKKSNAENTASFLLKQKDVREEIKRVMSQAAKQLDIDENFVLKRLKDHVDHEDARISLEALKTIGNHLGMFVKKVDNTHHFKSQDDFVNDLYHKLPISPQEDEEDE